MEIPGRRTSVTIDVHPLTETCMEPALHYYIGTQVTSCPAMASIILPACTIIPVEVTWAGAYVGTKPAFSMEFLELKPSMMIFKFRKILNPLSGSHIPGPHRGHRVSCLGRGWLVSTAPCVYL